MDKSISIEQFAARISMDYHSGASDRHDFCIDIKKLESSTLRDIFDTLVRMNATNDNSAMKQLLINTLIANGAIQQMRIVSIDNILNDLENPAS